MPEHGCLKARGLFVSCMDLRTQCVRRRLIDYLGIDDGTFDLVAVPGGAGDLRQLKRCLKVSRLLHDVPEVILTVHEDCGAGASRKDLLRAVRIARSMGVAYRAFYLFRMEDDWEWEEVFFSEEEILPLWVRLWRKLVVTVPASCDPVFDEE